MKFKDLFSFLWLFLSLLVKLQKDESRRGNKSEIFSSEFIDVMNHGQINASARFLLNRL